MVRQYRCFQGISQYLCAMLSPKFIVSLCVCARFSRLLLPVSQVLQSSELDLTQCAREISVILQVVRDCRENAVANFKILFFKAQELSVDPITIPRKIGRQLMRANYDTDDLETFYRQAICRCIQWWDSAGSHRFYRTVSRNFI